jgi:outer membrane protein assembly factor BamA
MTPVRGGSVCRTAVLSALLLICLPGPDLQGQNATRPEVVELRFQGNAAFSDQDLSRAIITRETQCRSVVLQPFCWLNRDFALDRSYLNNRWLRDDYIRLHLFYRQRGYGEVQVDTVLVRPSPETVEVTFRIEEGSPRRVTSLEFVGLEELPDGERISQNLPIRVGDPLNRVLVDAARDTIIRRLRNQGYPHTDVFRNLDMPRETYDATVEFDIFTGPFSRFGPIEVSGNQEVNERTVRRMLPFREGSPYNRELIFEAQRNLFNLEIFRRAQVIQDLEHEPDSIVPLRVEVAEGRTHRVRAGGGWNTAECFSTEARWSSRNFRGGARRLVLRTRMSNILTSTLEDSLCRGAGTEEFGELNWLVSADFTQPFIFSPRNTLSASLFVERQSVQDVFVRRAEGVNLILTRQVGRGTPVALSYRPQRVRLEAAEVFFCTNFLVCRPEDIGLLQGSNLLSPVGLSVSRDRTDRAFNPRAGYRVVMDLEHAAAWTGSNFAYERVVGELAFFREVFGDLVVASRVRGGWMGPRAFRDLLGEEDVEPRIAHPQKRFFAGGANSVRGFAQNQLGPRVLIVAVEDLVEERNGEPPVCAVEEVLDLTCDASPLADGVFTVRPSGGSTLLEGSVELRFPVWGDNLDGATFMDFGQVWSRSRDVGLDDLEFTPGLGLRYQTPVGPVRVDLAYRSSRAQDLRVVTSLRPDLADDVQPGELALLGPSVTFGDTERFSRRLQLQLSIGHAF